MTPTLRTRRAAVTGLRFALAVTLSAALRTNSQRLCVAPEAASHRPEGAKRMSRGAPLFR